MKRDFDDQTTTIMRHIERILDNWTPALGFVGTILVDIGIDLARHYTRI